MELDVILSVCRSLLARAPRLVATPSCSQEVLHLSGYRRASSSTTSKVREPAASLGSSKSQRQEPVGGAEPDASRAPRASRPEEVVGIPPEKAPSVDKSLSQRSFGRRDLNIIILSILSGSIHLQKAAS